MRKVKLNEYGLTPQLEAMIDARFRQIERKKLSRQKKATTDHCDQLTKVVAVRGCGQVSRPRS